MNRSDAANSAIFCAHGPEFLKLSDTGCLSNSRLAVKDVFALKGEKNAAGNPDWYSAATPASAHSYAVNALLNQGSEFVGFTQTDELAYSLEGNNIHYGAADNPRYKGHSCGGSSMGSAAAVACEAADIGLGTDTGGSIRVPASYCGLFGIRPSHGVIPSEGLIPLAPAFDTTGWMCREVGLLEKVGEILLPTQAVAPVKELLVCRQLFALVAPDLTASLLELLPKLAEAFDSVTEVELDAAVLAQLADTFRVLQGREIARTHGAWLTECSPVFSDAIANRFAMAMALTDDEEQQARLIQHKLNVQLSQILSPGGALLLPTTPTTAPRLKSDTSGLRSRIMTLTAIAGLTGSPQIHLPLQQQTNERHTAPFGFSLLMAKHNDRNLLKLAKAVTKHLTSGEVRETGQRFNE